MEFYKLFLRLKMESPIVEIPIENESRIQLFIKREDLLHPYISGNKYRKLKYNLEEAKRQGKALILTFGGAFSNHIAATAYAGQLYNFKTIGVIRGEELQTKIDENPTLKFAKTHGMQLHFVSREVYRKKEDIDFQMELKEQFEDAYIIPEGGTNTLAVKGCEEILSKDTEKYDYVCTSVGTGGTISGLINTSQQHQKVMGFSALKGDFLQEDICKFATKNNWVLNTDYHFGGYAKINEDLVSFINAFKAKYKMQLDPIYTGKMLFGIMDMIAKHQFEKHSKILAIHTGGLQGISGMNQILKQKSMPLITM